MSGGLRLLQQTQNTFKKFCISLTSHCSALIPHRNSKCEEETSHALLRNRLCNVCTWILGLPAMKLIAPLTIAFSKEGDRLNCYRNCWNPGIPFTNWNLLFLANFLFVWRKKTTNPVGDSIPRDPRWFFSETFPLQFSRGLLIGGLPHTYFQFQAFWDWTLWVNKQRHEYMLDPQC